MKQGMASENDSSVKEFILLGLTQQPELQLPLFFFFLGIYVVSMVGNLGLIVLIVLNSLHTPMYYFLFNLSFTDLCFSSVIIPKMLVSFVKQNTISHAECMTQFFFFCFFVINEFYILTAMAYGKYAAICKPLLYQVTMSYQVCHSMMVGVYVMGFFGGLVHTGNMLSLSFCDGNIINHYMCDVLPLLKLSCTDTAINELVVFIVGGINIIVPCVTVFISYTFILSSIIGIRSAEGRSKAFSTFIMQGMTSANDSSVKEFILLGLTRQSELQLPLFFLFLGIYVVSMVGNLGLIVLIVLNSHLHTPMYYFLFNLSFTDLCYSSVITPKMLLSFVKQNTISYAECMTQLFFFCFFSIDECYILTAMAYDRYVAICKPLLYHVNMSHDICHLMMVGAYVMGIVGAIANTSSVLSLTFCDGNIINHYMCDIPPLRKLSCTSTYINELVIFIVVGVNVIVPNLTIFISYTLILSNILGIHSAEASQYRLEPADSSDIAAIASISGSN
ncbi:hypothetical protein U0070_014730 [Myodes glareolus]|uniref:G-protein coupled receptors family 1 profile domain-containing protein n=1 Tax=Myodes glareolus TaxID=447135 RepID=A0AAW0HWA1_MYOGA